MIPSASGPPGRRTGATRWLPCNSLQGEDYPHSDKEIDDLSLYRSSSRCSSKLERRCAPAPSYCSARPQRLTVECTRCPMASVKRATHGKFVEVQARRRRIMIKAEALGARARLPLRRWARRAVSTTHGSKYSLFEPAHRPSQLRSPCHGFLTNDGGFAQLFMLTASPYFSRAAIPPRHPQAHHSRHRPRPVLP